MTITTDTVALNISYVELLLTVYEKVASSQQHTYTRVPKPYPIYNQKAKVD